VIKTYDLNTKKFLSEASVPVNPQPQFLKVAGTGHRNIGKNITITADGRIFCAIRDELMQLLEKINPKQVISGMAIGFDLALADAAAQTRIPFTAAVPFKGHGALWGKANKSKHDTLLGLASVVVYTSEDYRNAGVYVIRDQWMVNNSDSLFAFYDGRGTGGTKITMDYAEKQGKPILNVWNQKESWV
jgi:uncharacterized phage-like protein YoqJ